MNYAIVWEKTFDEELMVIEPNPVKADCLLRRIEQLCLRRVGERAKGYGFVRFYWNYRHLHTWYLASGATITVLSIQLEMAIAA